MDVNTAPELLPSPSTPQKPDNWKTTLFNSFDKWTPDKVRHDYVGFTEKVMAANPDLTPDQVWEKIQDVENINDYKFHGVRYSRDSFRKLVSERKRLKGLTDLNIATEADVAKLTKLRQSFQKEIDRVVKATGDDPVEVTKNIDSALSYGVAHSLREARMMLIEGPVVVGFEETSDPIILNEAVSSFLKDTFGAQAIRRAKIGRVIKDDQYLIFSNYSDEDVKRGNELVTRGFATWENGMPLAKSKDAYIRAALFLEGVDNPDKLKHLYKIRATAGDTHGFHTIDLHSFGVEKSTDFDYLADIPLQSEEDKIRAYIIGTLAHEVTHRYTPQLSQVAMDQYQNIVDTETSAGRKHYVSDYTLRHDEVYKTDKKTVLDEDIAEAVRIYATNPDYLKEHYPQRSAFIREQFPFVKAGGVVEAVKSLKRNTPIINSREKLRQLANKDNTT